MQIKRIRIFISIALLKYRLSESSSDIGNKKQSLREQMEAERKSQLKALAHLLSSKTAEG